MKLFDLTATGRYYKVLVDGVEVSQHTTEREAVEKAHARKLENPSSSVTYTHDYEVQVALTDAGITIAQDYGTQQDVPPTISSTPSPTFTEGTADTYDMTQHVSDDGISTVTYSLSNTLPNGLSFNGSTGVLTYDGIAPASVSAHALTATDAVGNATSSSFNINISDAILFSENFDSDPSDWECSDGTLPGWSGVICGVDGTFGSEFKMGPGRLGGNAVYAWKSSAVPNGYRTQFNHWLYDGTFTDGTQPLLKNEIYHRWYMKWDPTADKYAVEGFKMWRYLMQQNKMSSVPTMYLNIRGGGGSELGTTGGGLISEGDLILLHTDSTYTYGRTLIPMSEIMDNTWHCHELRLKLNTVGPTTNDGVIQYWLDGVLRATHTGIGMQGNTTTSTYDPGGPNEQVIPLDSDNWKIYRFGCGIGNVSQSAWLNSDWAAIAFDDVAVSTEYIGP